MTDHEDDPIIREMRQQIQVRQQQLLRQRLIDQTLHLLSAAYVNATALCKAHGRDLDDYLRLPNTREFVVELSAATGVPEADLVQTRDGDVWVDRRMAINLACWVSARCAVVVCGIVEELLTTGSCTSGSPAQRLLALVRRAERQEQGTT